MALPKSFTGYRRENGRVGIRNHVVILPLDDLSNAACEKIANNVKGTIALPHHYGRLQFGADLDLHFRTLIGTGCNPNVAAVVVVGEQQLRAGRAWRSGEGVWGAVLAEDRRREDAGAARGRGERVQLDQELLRPLRPGLARVRQVHADVQSFAGLHPSFRPAEVGRLGPERGLRGGPRVRGRGLRVGRRPRLAAGAKKGRAGAGRVHSLEQWDQAGRHAVFFSAPQRRPFCRATRPSLDRETDSPFFPPAPFGPRGGSFSGAASARGEPRRGFEVRTERLRCGALF